MDFFGGSVADQVPLKSSGVSNAQVVAGFVELFGSVAWFDFLEMEKVGTLDLR